jgi:hypothetical protein
VINGGCVTCSKGLYLRQYGGWFYFSPPPSSWLFSDFIKQFEMIEPLSNFQIIEKCKELKIKNFKGVFMREELNKT